MEGKDCDQCEMENDDNVSSDSDDMSEYELPLAKLPQKRKHQSSDESSSSDQEADEPPAAIVQPMSTCRQTPAAHENRILVDWHKSLWG